MKALGLMVSEKKVFVCFSHCKYMGANDPQDAIFDPRGMIGRIYVEHHITLLHTLYTSFGYCGFREEDFLGFSYYKHMADIHALGCGQFGPKGHGWQDL